MYWHRACIGVCAHCEAVAFVRVMQWCTGIHTYWLTHLSVYLGHNDALVHVYVGIRIYASLYIYIYVRIGVRMHSDAWVHTCVHSDTYASVYVFILTPVYMGWVNSWKSVSPSRRVWSDFEVFFLVFDPSSVFAFRRNLCVGSKRNWFSWVVGGAVQIDSTSTQDPISH